MKKAVKTFFALAAISLALCSCSDSGSSGSDVDIGTENRVLDLRIQNGGVARWIEDFASGTYEAHTELVSVTAESDGMHFTIKNPANLEGSDEKYQRRLQLDWRLPLGKYRRRGNPNNFGSCRQITF